MILILIASIGLVIIGLGIIIFNKTVAKWNIDGITSLMTVYYNKIIPLLTNIRLMRICFIIIGVVLVVIGILLGISYYR